MQGMTRSTGGVGEYPDHRGVFQVQAKCDPLMLQYPDIHLYKIKINRSERFLEYGC